MKWLLLVSLWAVGCAANSPAPPTASHTPAAAVAAKTRALITVTRGGQEDFRLEPQGDSLQIVCQGKTYTTKIESERVKVFAGEQLQTKAKRKEAGFELENAAGQRLLRAKYKQGPDIRFEDGKDQVLLHLMPQADRLRWLGPSNQALGEIRQENGELHLLNATKKVVATLKGSTHLEVASVLPLENLTPLERATLALYLAEVGP